jgi:hypothetical protein
MDRDEWLANHLPDAVGELPGRHCSPSTAVNDLIRLEQLTSTFGNGLDARLARGYGESYGTFPDLLDAIDPDGELGAVARKRIDSAHNIALAGAICAIQSLVYAELPPPAGIKVTSWTKTTKLRKGTPGVVVFEPDVRTRTVLIMSVVGGEHRTAYNLPILVEPARDPTSLRSLAHQAVHLAACGRMLVRHYAPQVGGIRIGSLPVLLGRIRSAGPHPQLGGIFSEPVALADMPVIVDELAHYTDAGVPFLAQACYGSDGRPVVPDGWFLDVTPTVGADAERPGAMSGLGEKKRNNIVEFLLGDPDAVGRGLLERVPDTAGSTWLARGSILARGEHGFTPFGVLGYVSLEGQPTIALTNIVRTPVGLNRLSMAVEGLAGSASSRARCRKRLSSFVGHIDLPTDTTTAARRVFGLIVMAYHKTVVARLRET